MGILLGEDIVDKNLTNPHKKRRIELIITTFSNLPNEILLQICSYLSPEDVLRAFYEYNQHLYNCIFKYHQTINLTNYLYSDLRKFLYQYSKNRLQPTTLIFSNKKISNEIELFRDTYDSSCFQSKLLQNLSLLECKQKNLYSICSGLYKFQSLKSLHIHESTLEQPNEYLTSSILSDFQQLIFGKPLINLEELTFVINNGMLITKQLHSNSYLKYLTISLINLHDLYILLDGLVPNLIYLKVLICQENLNQRMTIPKSSSKFLMSNLIEFILNTNENVRLTLEQLYAIFIPLKHLITLTLNINNFIDDTQTEIDIEQYLSKLKYFSCSIQTTSNIDIRFKNWSMIMCQNNDLKKHFYTNTVSFEQMHLSMISTDEIQNIHYNIQHLIIDRPFVTVPHCFANIHTLTIAIDDGDFSNYTMKQFPGLRHLIIKHINIISSSILRRISTLTLSNIDDLFNHSRIYSNIRYLIIKESTLGSSEKLIRLLKYFPDLHSIEILLESNNFYFANLDILINHEYLPNLSWLETNWIKEIDNLSNIKLQISSNTSLKWRQTEYQMDSDLQAVCNLIQEYFLIHPDPQRERKVYVTIAAFYIFHNRAADYAKLPACASSTIRQRLVTLLDTESTLVTPECPEVESNCDDTNMILFQKINRYLFAEVDSLLEEYLHAEMLTLPNTMLLPLLSLSTTEPIVAELPVPPIEWATNILEQFDYISYINLESSLSLNEWMKTIIDQYYDPNNLIHYLQSGWNAVLMRYSEVMTNHNDTVNRTKLLETFIDRLRNTMCYPARLSILSYSLD